MWCVTFMLMSASSMAFSDGRAQPEDKDRRTCPSSAWQITDQCAAFVRRRKEAEKKQWWVGGGGGVLFPQVPLLCALFSAKDDIFCSNLDGNLAWSGPFFLLPSNSYTVDYAVSLSPLSRNSIVPSKASPSQPSNLQPSQFRSQKLLTPPC